MRRPTATGVTAAHAECQECNWRTDRRNAIGNAARHHDATGHYVEVEQVISVAYGAEPGPEDHGQITIDEAIDSGGSLEP